MFVGFYVLSVVTIWRSIFWNVRPCTGVSEEHNASIFWTEEYIKKKPA
jgi:hypothetical protein